MMQRAYETENELMVAALTALKFDGKLSEELKDVLTKVFGERFNNGMELANSQKVKRYDFSPSGRIVWVVQGRKGEYQVLPEVPFCYCDDYYFRVMDRKRGLCYHIIAQRIAEVLNQFTHVPVLDAQYSTITDRWRARERTGEFERSYVG